MKILERYMPHALKAAELLQTDSAIPKEYNGYIASFGASIKQSGIPITVAMFMRGDRDAQDKKKLLDAIWKIVTSTHPAGEINETKMFDYYKAHHPGSPVVNLHVEYAAIALKLAIRTFPQKNN